MCVGSQVCRLELGKKQSDLVFYTPGQPVRLYQGKGGEEGQVCYNHACEEWFTALPKGSVRSGLLHDQKNMRGVVYCTTKRAHEEWFTVLPKDLLGVVYCTTKRLSEEWFTA